MLEFEKTASWDGKEFLRCKGKKRNTTYTIIKNKSYSGDRYKATANFDMLCTNCTLKTAIRLCNEYEERLKEPQSFSASKFFKW